MEGCLTSRMSADWLSIRQASRLLGAHIDTVRAWADAGLITSYRTPGGHRRFSRADLLTFLKHQNQPPSLDRRMEQTLTRLRQTLSEHSHADWFKSQTTAQADSERVRQREIGQRLLACVVNFVEQPEAYTYWLTEGRRIAREYGNLLMSSGVSAGNAARATIYFRQFILKAVLEVKLGSRTGDEEDAQLFQRVSTFLDEILLAILEAYP